MSFIANFTVSQGQDCSQLIITDTSDYSSEAKSTFSARRLYLYKTDGSTIKFPSSSTTDYIDFSFASYPSGIITITGIDKDYSLNIKLKLVPISPISGSTYEKSIVSTLICYTNTFLFNVVQIAATNPARISDQTFYTSWSELQTEKDAAVVAASYGDQSSSESALRRASSIMSQSNLRF